MRVALVLVLVLVFGAACAPAAPTPPAQQPESAWSAPFTLAQAQQADAPALVLSGGQMIAAWVGADDRGVHQDARRWLGGRWGDPLTLPLPPTHPYDQRLVPGLSGGAHLLWLDSASDGVTNLYTASLAPDLTVQRGPVSVSEGLALGYSAVPDGEGGLWAAWSGGLLSEMSVFVRRVDNEGRPLLETTRIADNAADPALVRADDDGSVWLFWVSDGLLLRRRLDAESSATAITGAVSLSAGDRLANVRAALDADTGYFFWNLTRRDGTSETWLTAGTLDAPNWSQPQRLSISLRDATLIDRGFAAGTVSSAALGGSTALRWLEPSTTQADTLLAAVESDQGLGIVLLRGGQVIGYADAAPGVHLIGQPSLAVTDSGGISLAWASPGDTAASLQVITTRAP